MMLAWIWRDVVHQLWRVSSGIESTLDGTYTEVVLAGIWELTGQLWYFVVLGAMTSTLVWRYLPRAWVRQVLERRARSSVAMAALLGLISPMCTFAAIPVVGTLMRSGVPAPPLVAFMVASPLMNPSLFIYTAGVIGIDMAIARLLTALSVGLAAGVATRYAVAHGWLFFASVHLEGAPGILCSRPAGQPPRGWRGESLLLGRRFLSDMGFIGRYFGLGISIAALVRVFMSPELVMMVMGRYSGWAVPAAVALGIPLYACGGGSLPVIESMMRLGMTTGAALAFFIAGPATKFSTVSMLAAVFGRRVLALYLLVMLGGALFWGSVYPFDTEYLQVDPGGYEIMDRFMSN